jgi:hypothetical protein
MAGLSAHFPLAWDGQASGFGLWAQQVDGWIALARHRFGMTDVEMVTQLQAFTGGATLVRTWNQKQCPVIQERHRQGYLALPAPAAAGARPEYTGQSYTTAAGEVVPSLCSVWLNAVRAKFFSYVPLAGRRIEAFASHPNESVSDYLVRFG